MTRSVLIASRVFAVLAAMFMVGAFALATLPAADLSLAEALDNLGHDTVRHLHDGILAHFGNRAWLNLALPLLVRPVWLLPASLGLICIGGAASFASRPTPRRRRRHRS